MKEYIERDALMSKQWVCRTADIDGATYADLRDIADYIAEFPAADVVERKRGEWVDAPTDGVWTTRCTYCGNEEPEHKHTNFCHNCGADMREVDHEVD